MQSNSDKWNVSHHMRRFFLLIALFVPTASVAVQNAGTELRTKLDVRVAEYALSANGLADALAKTSQRFELPMGIEWLKDKQTVMRLSRTWTDETVGRILRSIVDAYPGYSFRVEDGVVHVFRQDLLNDHHNFLNLKLPSFLEVPREAGGLINQALRSVVQNTVSPRNLPPGTGEAGSYATGLAEKPLSLELRGVSVREALQKLAEASEHKMWVVTFAEGLTMTPTGFYRTETLWHPRPFPDRDQPMWDSLAWAEYAEMHKTLENHPNTSR